MFVDLTMKTFIPKEEDAKRRWFLVDASSVSLGRLASVVAGVLRGKHKPIYTPHLDMGDYVIVVNCKNVSVSGRKMTQKYYYRHTGYVGNLRKTSLRDMLKKDPIRVVEIAVRGMLPKNRLARAVVKKLKVYAGVEHTHSAQQPVALEIAL